MGEVDLLEVDCISFTSILIILAEVGTDLSKFPSAKHFTSWLCLSPNNKISGGKYLSQKTQKNKHPLAKAFRDAANSMGNSKHSVLGHFFRRIAFKKGRAVAITATARKLATIVYHMLTKGVEFNYIGEQEYLNQYRNQKVKNIQKQIKTLGISVKELNFTAQA